jgi:protein-arginine kinase activator protein McsA
VNNNTTKHRLCAECARRSAGNALEAAGDIPDVANLPLEDIVKNIFGQSGGLTLWGKNGPAENEEEESEAAEVTEFSWSLGLGEFPGDEDLVDELDEADEEFIDADEMSNIDSSLLPSLSTDDEDAASNVVSPLDTLGEGAWSGPVSTQAGAFGDAAKQVRSGHGTASVRCPKCDTTWDRLRQDGRAGCAQCYSTFADQLSQVMERVQRASQHAGKAPRTAEKRHRRLLHLRARRDHRLEMLNRRLGESIAQEKYEEAAKLRDKIKMLTSTIVDE